MGDTVEAYLQRLPKEQRKYGSVLETYKDELRAFDTSNTVVRFTPEKPLPARMVTKLLKARMAEIEDGTQRK
jgi:hypothetical protein